MNLILIGFMGSGKSSVAGVLGQLLGRFVVEMDALVYQKTATQKMDEVFAKGGELLLRETEIAIAKEWGSKENLIISTGGGAVLNKIVLDYFKKSNGRVIFLHAQFDTIAKRLEGDDSRPLFQDRAAAQKLYEFRLPLYLHYADEVVGVDFLSPVEIAHTIHRKMGNGF